MINPAFLIVDLFCGAGGTTTGFATAKEGTAKVIACVNHDAKAIESHWKNHPEVKHFEEDIRTLDLKELTEVVKFQRSLYPDAKLILWASLECTNFSKAKGGQPRDADSRTLADHLHRYITAITPDYVMIENVVEFMSWGPLDANGKPVSRKNGTDYLRWCREVCAHGYVNEWRELNSADFGAYTSRNRLFGIFARPELPITWPQPTHSKKPGTGMFKNLQKWMPVKDVLDFSDEGESIFARKKSLSEKTLERIYAGCIKFIAKGDTSFISKYFSGGSTTGETGVHHPPSIEEPSPVIAAQSRLGLVQGEFIVQRNNGDPKSKIVSVDGPARTITATGGNQDLVQPQFLQHYYGNGFATGTNEPCPTLTTKERCALVQPEFISAGQNQSINQPAGSIMTNDKHSLVAAVPFVMPTSYDNNAKSIEEPAPTLQASRRHHYLVNPSHGGHSTSTDAPCPVIVARQDKAPLYLVQVENGPVAVAIYEGDTPYSIKLKQFMAAHGLVDIKMRMLRVHELLKIQGFPHQYVLCGNQSDQKKFIGNSVVPLVVKVWAEALAEKITDNRKVA